MRPIVDVLTPLDFAWQWPLSFAVSGVQRLQDLGYLTPDRALEVRRAFEQSASAPGVLMVTPGVLEIVAVRR